MRTLWRRVVTITLIHSERRFVHDVLEAGFRRCVEGDGRCLVNVIDPNAVHAAERKFGVTQLPQARVDRLEVTPTGVRELVPNTDVSHT